MASINAETKREALEYAGRLKGQMQRIKLRAKDQMENALTTAATVGTGLALGYARGRMSEGRDDDFEVAGVPIDVLAGVSMLGLSYFGAFGQYEKVGLAVGNGALTSYAVLKGVELGHTAKTGTDKVSGRRTQQVGPGVRVPPAAAHPAHAAAQAR